MFYEAQHLIKRQWDIIGYPDYFVGSDKKVYSVNKVGNVVESKPYLKGYTMGFFLKGRFFSLVKLRQMLVKLSS
jgi:hypothetical protein